MRLNGAKSLVRSRFFPCYFGFRRFFKFNVLVGIGGNMGNTKARFDKFIRELKNDRRFWLVESSPILINKAFGYEAQPDFLNSVINLQTSLAPNTVLKILQHYESRFGRKRSFKNAPRTLDLDILYFSTKVRRSKRLVVPHYGVKDRISVIVPMGLMIA